MALSSRARWASPAERPCPFVVPHDQRQRIEFPAAIAALGIAVDVVGDAVFVDQPARLLPAAFELVATQGVEQLEELGANAGACGPTDRAIRRTRPAAAIAGEQSFADDAAGCGVGVGSFRVAEAAEGWLAVAMDPAV